MQKLIYVAAVAILTLGTGSTSAWQSGRTVPSCELPNCLQIQTHSHSVCVVSDCIQLINHEHGGIIYYAAHHESDGHDHNWQNTADDTVSTTVPYNCGVSGCLMTEQHDHTVCNQPDCDKTTNHNHNGLVYYGHNNNDGHAYHNCGVSGCMQATGHNHNSCGVNGCNNTGSHSHDKKNSGHKSGHGGGHH